MIRVYACLVNPDEDSGLSDNIRVFLSPEKQLRIRSCHHRMDALRSLTGEMLIRKIVRDRFGIPFEEIRISCDERGKLHLLYPSSFHFNISHSGSWVLCAAGDGAVGVDIEKIESDVFDFQTARTVFSPREMDYLFSLKEEDRAAGFYDLWTLKESYLKCLGTGMINTLTSLTILPEKGGFYTSGLSGGEFYFRRLPAAGGYRAAVCSVDPDIKDHIQTCVPGEKACPGEAYHRKRVNSDE